MGTKTRDHANLNFQKLNNTLVDWQSVHVADGSTVLTAVAGRGYFINTTSGAQTVNLPSPSNSESGDTIQLKDYARTWGTNSVTMGSNTFDGIAGTSPEFSTDGQTVTLIYMDDTKGWSLINDDTTTNLGRNYVAATGGTVTTSGDFKIHTFTGDGCFVVSDGGNAAGSNTVDYLVVAGGGGSGFCGGNAMGGGGAGGFRYSASTYCSPTCAPGHPLRSPTGLPVSATTYPITVGGGGSGGATSGTQGGDGSNSQFSTITSAGGGKGAKGPVSCGAGGPGGSGGGGGGGGFGRSGGTGNTPPVSPSQGNPGGDSTPASPLGPDHASGGGGGAIAAGTDGRTSPAPTSSSGPGGAGAGVPNAFGTSGENCGSHYYFSGGGAGEYYGPVTPEKATGGIGGGGNGGGPGQDGTANTGGGGAGGGTPGSAGGAGGKGIVIIRYKFQ